MSPKSENKFKSTRISENFHILFWLIKDLCWVMEIKLLGVSMIIPTILIALYIAYLTLGKPEFYVNLSVLFWIVANSFWMCAEFYDFLELKYITLFPFSFGFLSFFYYLFLLLKPDTNKS